MIYLCVSQLTSFTMEAGGALVLRLAEAGVGLGGIKVLQYTKVLSECFILL